jgi:ribosome-binding protein aMBF1 (putative translation factor)
MHMDPEDWDVVTLRKKVAERAGGGAPPATKSLTSSKPAWAIERRVDDVDSGKPILDMTSRQEARRIVERRTALLMKQSDLAMRVNTDVKEIQAIEAGRAVENRNLLAKIWRVLDPPRAQHSKATRNA